MLLADLPSVLFARRVACQNKSKNKFKNLSASRTSANTGSRTDDNTDSRTSANHTQERVQESWSRPDVLVSTHVPYRNRSSKEYDGA